MCKGKRSEKPQPILTILVPMYNEEEGIDLFFDRVGHITDALDFSYEIICVNDGSTDGTLNKLIEHRDRDRAIKIIDLSRNFGKEAALSAGIENCAGDYLIPIDADLEEPPEIIPRMIEKLQEGYDVVYAVRDKRADDSFFKRVTARSFYKIYNVLSKPGIPSDTGDYRIISRKVIEALKSIDERNRFMKGLFSWVGFRQTSISYNRKGQLKGTSKWSYLKLWNYALDGITSFSTIPLRIWTYVGIITAATSFLYASFLIIRTLIYGKDVPGYASLMVVMLFLGGIQLLSIGIIGEYLGRIYLETKRRPLYLVRERYGFEEN